MMTQFKNDILEGLSKKNKTLPSKYFYDKKGDELFQKIMAMPEYYLTNAEMDIFKNQTVDLVDALNQKKDRKFEVVELGAGDGTKTIHLLNELEHQKYDFEYLPIDISQNALDGLSEMLKEKLPSLKVKPMQGDYFKRLENIQHSSTPKVVLFLGSNIGNLSDDKAAKFVYNLGAFLSSGDKIVLGVDLIKDAEIVLPAYNDEHGITAEFNLNLLDRINKEFDANFNRNNFAHRPEYTKEEGVAKSYLVSTISQTVTIDGQEFEFSEGEKIHTEISRKYNDQIIDQILSKTDLVMENKILDKNALFADYILRKK